MPGLTAIDAAALVRSKNTPQPRNRLLSWISGESESDVPSRAEAHAVAPPDDDVRREILRLELEAQVANLQAETDSIRAEAAAEGRTIDLPDIATLMGGVPDAAPADDADKPAETGSTMEPPPA